MGESEGKAAAIGWRRLRLFVCCGTQRAQMDSKQLQCRWSGVGGREWLIGEGRRWSSLRCDYRPMSAAFFSAALALSAARFSSLAFPPLGLFFSCRNKKAGTETAARASETRPIVVLRVGTAHRWRLDVAGARMDLLGAGGGLELLLLCQHEKKINKKRRKKEGPERARARVSGGIGRHLIIRMHHRT